MATLDETTVVDKIEIIETGVIQVRTATRVRRDGVHIAETFDRCAYAPGDDVSQADPKVQSISAAIWTVDVVAAYRAAHPVPPIPSE